MRDVPWPPFWPDGPPYPLTPTGSQTSCPQCLKLEKMYTHLGDQRVGSIGSGDQRVGSIGSGDQRVSSLASGDQRVSSLASGDQRVSSLASGDQRRTSSSSFHNNLADTTEEAQRALHAPKKESPGLGKGSEDSQRGLEGERKRSDEDLTTNPVSQLDFYKADPFVQSEHDLFNEDIFPKTDSSDVFASDPFKGTDPFAADILFPAGAGEGGALADEADTSLSCVENKASTGTQCFESEFPDEDSDIEISYSHEDLDTIAADADRTVPGFKPIQSLSEDLGLNETCRGWRSHGQCSVESDPNGYELDLAAGSPPSDIEELSLASLTGEGAARKKTAAVEVSQDVFDPYGFKLSQEEENQEVLEVYSHDNQEASFDNKEQEVLDFCSQDNQELGGFGRNQEIEDFSRHDNQEVLDLFSNEPLLEANNNHHAGGYISCPDVADDLEPLRHRLGHPEAEPVEPVEPMQPVQPARPVRPPRPSLRAKGTAQSQTRGIDLK
ncbi:hypothetical protein NHX12_004617 [Muraenolepis orangiensis]|uniref:Uncharacterized protein n=1 Tax=Muraenolepis orangiensis TaxID=630683 RepID=A0A9Q0DVU5_9TELE|nr:hypothetical protein NHX12_004617 [Muraenolepis orangiensis]